MRPAESRFRVLALLCVSTALGLALWRGGLRRGAGNDARQVHATAVAAAPVVAQATDSAPPATSSDSAYAQATAGYGVLLPQGSDSIANFYFVTLADSSTSLASLGFIPTTNLLDSTTQFEPYGDVARLRHFRVASPAVVDSALRGRDDGCVLEVPVPVRPALPPDGSWTIALAPGAAEALRSSVWRIAGDSLAQRGEALRLAASLPTDTSGVTGLERARAALAAAPLELVTHYRFVADGVEIMIVETHRASKAPTDTAADTGPTLEEQRVLIAERDALDKTAPFRVRWHHYSVDDPDQLATEMPKAMLRLGRARALTLLTDGRYRDGAGGLFVVRVGRGRWRTAASWYTGC